jgi:hypothetical protein
MRATGKNIEAKLAEKEKEVHLLRQRDSVNTQGYDIIQRNFRINS